MIAGRHAALPPAGALAAPACPLLPLWRHPNEAGALPSPLPPARLQLGHVVCGGCQVTLAYAYGAQKVKCSVCGFVTPCTHGGGGGAAQQLRPQQPGAMEQQQQQQEAATASSRPSHTVVVLNPGGEGSGEGSNVAIGVSGDGGAK